VVVVHAVAATVECGLGARGGWPHGGGVGHVEAEWMAARRRSGRGAVLRGTRWVRAVAARGGREHTACAGMTAAASGVGRA
jgi:hypothetical protein